jgi:hypothetical protein
VTEPVKLDDAIRAVFEVFPGAEVLATDRPGEPSRGTIKWWVDAVTKALASVCPRCTAPAGRCCRYTGRYRDGFICTARLRAAIRAVDAERGLFRGLSGMLLRREAANG